MIKWPFDPIDWREAYRVAPWVLGVFLLQAATEYFIYGYIDATLAIILPIPIGGVPFLSRFASPQRGILL